jgi:hypothetical protein
VHTIHTTQLCIQFGLTLLRQLTNLNIAGTIQPAPPPKESPVTCPPKPVAGELLNRAAILTNDSMPLRRTAFSWHMTTVDCAAAAIKHNSMAGQLSFKFQKCLAKCQVT